ncbi:MAG: HD domain-containing protein [Candidatus Staskawiczbacteria bacterium]|nr:HD domain-containing protein [Candidatus Staskawiczbacteria bacterium]
MSNSTQKLILQITEKSSDPQLIEDAFLFARLAYKEKFMASGENYINHATRVAWTLDKMNLDPQTIAFGLLHDVMDEKILASRQAEREAIEKKFGKEVAGLLEKISELRKIRYPLEINVKEKKTLTRERLENIRKMFLAIAGDLRVVLVELISRLDGLNFLDFLPDDKRKLHALETLQIFVPIAHRLGLSEIRRKMEDISFSYLFPKRYKWLKENMKEEYEERERYLKKFIPRLKKILSKERIKVIDINYRVKSYWSTYKKLTKKGMDFSKIHDLLAIRVIVDNVEYCYRALGIIHKHFKPISEEIDDYIAKPKSNGYRSLHTTIFSDENRITEIQIKTEEMHKEAEYGICAHWSYKEKIDLKKEGKSFEWIKDMSDFWQNFKIDFFPDKIFNFTPKGDIIVLPRGSTPVDFAYAVHSEVGNHCESAKINNKIVQLSHTLENGDIVEITTNKKKTPSKDWLRFVKTSFAKSHIKKTTTENETGFRLPIPGFIKRKIIEISEAARKKKEEKKLIAKEGPRQLYLAGQKGMLIHRAKCCNPQPGDKVKAYITQRRAAVLHRTSCENFKKIAKKFPEKIVDASWE